MLYQESARCFPAPFEANRMNRAPTRTTQLEFRLLSFPSNEACSPSSVSWRPYKSTRVMVLLASRAAARACQCWRLLLQKPTQAEGYPEAISHNESLGCWRLVKCYNSYFHTCLKFQTHHGYKLWNCLIDPLDLDAPDGPPNSPSGGHLALSPLSPIGLYLSTSCPRVLLTRRASAKAWERCKQSVRRMTRGKAEQKISYGPIEGILVYHQGGQSDKAVDAFRKHCARKKVVDSKTRSRMCTTFVGPWEKKLADPTKKISDPICVWARSNSK